MRISQILGLFLVLPLALAGLGLHTTAAPSPPPSTAIDCNSCSIPVVIPAGSPQTLVTYGSVAEAAAVAESDAAVVAVMNRWIASKVAHLRCGECPYPASGCPRSVHSDNPTDAGYVDVIDNGDGTGSLVATFDEDFWIWICCGSCDQ